MEKKRGHYLGTEVDEKWYKRYRKDGFFIRGNGEYWFEEDGLYFRRYLTKQPLVVPFHQIRQVKLGSWHAGKWVIAKRVIKLVWEKDGQTLSSGFILARGKADTEMLKSELELRISS
jgi:hypothetical protein